MYFTYTQLYISSYVVKNMQWIAHIDKWNIWYIHVIAYLTYHLLYSWKEPLLWKESSERIVLNLKANLCAKGEERRAHLIASHLKEWRNWGWFSLIYMQLWLRSDRDR